VANVSLTDVPDRVDLRVLAGRPFSVLLSLALGPGGEPVPFADLADARAHVRGDVGSEVIVYSFTTGDGTVALVDDDGDAAVRLVADAAATTQWQHLWPGRAPETVVWWDLEITDAAGERHQVTSPGTITLVHQVTRDPLT
jgi:hypothetical protein